MTEKLRGKVAIVTGASSGIGEATAIALAAEGAKVALAARRIDLLKALSQRIQDSDGEALAIEADVVDEGQMRDMMQKVQATWGQVDILINNAGVMLLGIIDGADTEDWRRMFNVNVLGLMYATHAVLPIMKAQSTGHIINISSVAGRIVRTGAGVYCASKWAVNAFSEALRQEVYKDKIRVTVIEPGVVATELPQHITNSDAKAGAEAYYQSIESLNSEDIATAVVYALTQPPHVCVNEMLIRPTEQER